MVQALLYHTLSSLILGSSHTYCCLGVFMIAHLAVILDGSPETKLIVLSTLLLCPSKHRSFCLVLPDIAALF